MLPEAEFCVREDFDITDPPQRDWRQYSAIINAAGIPLASTTSTFTTTPAAASASRPSLVETCVVPEALMKLQPMPMPITAMTM